MVLGVRPRQQSGYQSRVLEDLSDAANYRRWLADLVRPYLGDDPLEIGSGLGDYVNEWLSGTARCTATEADEDRLAVLRERFADDPRVTVRALALPAEQDAGHSAVVALNVLEHVADDVAALRSAGRLVRPGGAVVLVVPAFPSAMSRFDRAVGHHRRYTRRRLGTVLHQAGLATERLHYVNPIGLINWYLVCRGLGTFPHNGPLLRGYDRVVIPLARRMERRWRPPFGQSLLAVARRIPAQPDPGCRDHHAAAAADPVADPGPGS